MAVLRREFLLVTADNPDDFARRIKTLLESSPLWFPYGSLAMAQNQKGAHSFAQMMCKEWGE